MSKLTSEELYTQLSDALNNTLWDSTGFLEAFKKDHNTLQQKMVKLSLEVIKTMATEVPGWAIDGRNEAARAISEKLVKENPYLEYLPTV